MSSTELPHAAEPTLPPQAEPVESTDAAPAAGQADAPIAPAAQVAARPPEMNAADCARELKQRFPALFAGPAKPIKLRVQVDIHERAPGVFTKQALSAFFRRYTGTTSYLQSVAQGTQRLDLDGQPSGEISAEHRQIAVDELARRRAQHAAQHAEQRAAHRAEQRAADAEAHAARALEIQQRRNRAGLLYDWERTTLTRANFCVLKGVVDAELDGLLAIAREEAKQPRGPEPGERRDRHERQERRDGRDPHAAPRGGRDGAREGTRDGASRGPGPGRDARRAGGAAPRPAHGADAPGGPGPRRR